MIDKLRNFEIVNMTHGQVCNQCGVEIGVGDVCMATPSLRDGDHESDYDCPMRLKECLHCSGVGVSA